MIDELDTFNACATLALARVARFPALFSPDLASDVALAVQLPPADWSLEKAAAHQMFIQGHWFGKSGPDFIFSIYNAFWRRFPVTLEAVGNRVLVNAPHGAVKDVSPGQHKVVTDGRVGAIQTLTETWAMPDIEDVVLFSEDGWSEAEQIRLAGQLNTGSTVTLVRPGERCKQWFEPCRVRHDFSNFLELLGTRAELERLHHSTAAEPVMLTVFGVKARKL